MIFPEVKQTGTLSAVDVAQTLRDLDPAIVELKVHRLLYCCQGWHLAFTGKPLFDDRIEAYKNGPFCPNYFFHEEKESLPETEWEDAQILTVHWVSERYRWLTFKELGSIIRDEPPWKETRLGSTIPHETLRNFYLRKVPLIPVCEFVEHVDLENAPDDLHAILVRLAENTEQTGAKQYFHGRMLDPDYRAAYLEASKRLKSEVK